MEICSGLLCKCTPRDSLIPTVKALFHRGFNVQCCYWYDVRMLYFTMASQGFGGSADVDGLFISLSLLATHLHFQLLGCTVPDSVRVEDDYR